MSAWSAIAGALAALVAWKDAPSPALAQTLRTFAVPSERIGVTPKDWEILLNEARHQVASEEHRVEEARPLVEKLRQQEESLNLERFRPIVPVRPTTRHLVQR